MTDNRRSFVERILAPATSPLAVSPQVICMSAVVSALLHIFASSDLDSERLLVRTLMAMAAVVPGFLIVALAQLPKYPSAASAAGWKLASYALAGAARGIVMATLLRSIGAEGVGGWAYRVPTGAVTIGTTIAIVTFGWTTYTTHRLAARRLIAETEQLKDALAELERESQAEVLQQITQVSAGIARDLEQIELSPARAQMQQIQRIIDETVRPLSRAFADGIQKWEPSETPNASVRFRDVWSKAEPLDHLPQLWIASALWIAPFPTALYTFGWRVAALQSLLVLLTLALFIRFAYPLMRRGLHGMKMPWRELAITACLLLAAVGASATSYVALLGTSDPARYALSGFVGIPLYSWLVIISGTFWRDAIEQEERLRQVRASLRWAIARVNLLAWFNRGVMTRLLHGPVQNALIASMIRLRDADPEVVVNGVIRELQERLTEINGLTQLRHRDAAEIMNELQGVSELWAGIAAVELRADEAALDALVRDRAAAAIVFDLAQEICSNAIRHAGASSVILTFRSAERALLLDAQDNGGERHGTSRPGVGTQFLDTCSTHWSTERQGDVNHLSVTIPSIG